MRILSFKIPNIILFLLACATLSIVACKKESGSSSNPSIQQVRMLDSTKRDSFFTSALPGITVVIQGQGFDGLTNVYFNDDNAPFNSALNSDQNIVITIPADAPTEATNPNVSNKIRIVTTHGETTFDFVLVAPPPAIVSASNEMALPGSQITLYGSNFYILDKVIFPGNAEATNFTTSADGTTLTVTVPSNIESGGPITVVNKFGTAISPFFFNDNGTGMLCNFDDINTYVWGVTEISNSTSAFPGGRGTYAHMKASGINGGDWAWYDGQRSVNVGGGNTQWVPADHLGDPVDNYALKFEVNITSQNAWEAGKFFIVKDYDWTYLARWVGWSGDTKFSTNGWQTITIPLTQFKTHTDAGDGTGDPAPTLTKLLGSSGAGGLDVMFINDGTTTANIDVAFDNFRVIKVK